MEIAHGCVDEMLSRELSLTNRIQLQVYEVLQKSGHMGIDCDRLLLKNSPCPLGHYHTMAGPGPSFWVNSNDSPKKTNSLRLEVE